MRKYILVILLIVNITTLTAQRLFDHPMAIRSCKVDIKSSGVLTETWVELEFFNSLSEEIEGRFNFSLKQGQAITGFQLELNGKYREGSIEERWKAQRAYSTIVGKRIDPALLQMTGANNYTLNIYPVPANGSRKVKIRIEERIVFKDKRYQYELGLLNNYNAGKLDVSIISTVAQTRATTEKGLLRTFGFYGPAGQGLLSAGFVNKTVNEPISFVLTSSEPADDFCIDPGTGRFFCSIPEQKPGAAKFEVEKLRIYWDCSYSMDPAYRTKYVQLLNDILKKFPVSQLTIIPFNHQALPGRVFTGEDLTGGKWQTFVNGLPRYGATQIGNLDFDTMDDYILVFSDGNNSWGKRDITNQRVPTAIITGGIDLRRNYVPYYYQSNVYYSRTLPLRYFRLEDKPEVLFQQMVMEEIMFIGAEDGYGNKVEVNSPRAINVPLVVTGMVNANTRTIILKFGYGNKVLYKKRLTLSGHCQTDQYNKAQVLATFEELMQTNMYWYNTLAFGIDHKIVTWQTAYIVLERAEDYVKYNISPPDDLMDECVEKGYVKTNHRLRYETMQKMGKADVLKSVAEEYNNRLAWAGLDSNRIGPDETAMAYVRIEQEKVKYKNEMAGYDGVLYGNNSGDELKEVVVTAGYSMQKRRILTDAVSTVSGKDLVAYGDIATALQGRVPGVQVVTSGNPGDITNIRIRGAVSSALKNKPALVVDGIVTDFDMINQIHPNDIQYVDIVRSVPATVLFGSAATDGAIIITTKKGGNYYNFNYNQRVRLKDMEDVDYMVQIKDATKEKKPGLYLQLEKDNMSNASFYLDMAVHFHEAGLDTYIDDMMYKVAELNPYTISAQLSIAFVYEYLKEHHKAAFIYKELIEDYPDNLSLYRDLGWSLYQQGLYDSAVNVLYTGITREANSDNADLIRAKEIMLADMNMIIGAHKDVIDLSGIPKQLIRPVPSDLRVIVELSSGGFNNLFIREPGGYIADQQSPKAEGRGWLKIPSGSGFAEYQVKHAKRGAYRISLRHYSYGYYMQDAPLVKITRIRNFGMPGQLIETDIISLNNQFGEIEIDDIKVRR